MKIQSVDKCFLSTMCQALWVEKNSGSEVTQSVFVGYR